MKKVMVLVLALVLVVGMFSGCAEETEKELFKIETSEKDAREWGGTYILRDNKLYSLWAASSVEVDVEKPDDIGLRERDMMAIYFTYVSDKEMLSCGDIPVPTLEKKDKVISFGETQSIILSRLEFVGYSLPFNEMEEEFAIIKNFGDNGLEFDDDGLTFLKKSSIKDMLLFEYVSDEDLGSGAKVVELDRMVDYHDLKKNEMYLLSWFEKDDSYHEMRLCANCLYYKTVGQKFEIIGKLDPDNNYYQYDMSGIPPGTYRLDSDNMSYTVPCTGGIIEIK